MIGPLRRMPYAGVVLLLGCHAVYMGLALAREQQIGDARYDLGYVFAAFYIAAGLACVWFHLHPGSRQWWSWSGALLGGAYFARGLVIAQNGLELGWQWKHAIGLGTWAAWAGVVVQLWLHQFRPRTR